MLKARFSAERPLCAGVAATRRSRSVRIGRQRPCVPHRRGARWRAISVVWQKPRSRWRARCSGSGTMQSGGAWPDARHARANNVPSTRAKARSPWNFQPRDHLVHRVRVAEQAEGGRRRAAARSPSAGRPARSGCIGRGRKVHRAIGPGAPHSAQQGAARMHRELPAGRAICAIAKRAADTVLAASMAICHAGRDGARPESHRCVEECAAPAVSTWNQSMSMWPLPVALAGGERT